MDLPSLLVEIPTRCSFVIEFIIPKFIEGSTCFERTPLIIRSSELYLQPLVYIPMWWPAVAKADNGRSPHAYINQRLQIQFRAPDDERCALEICWDFNKLWNNKFYYKAASCWYFYWFIYDARIHEYQIYPSVSVCVGACLVETMSWNVLDVGWKVGLFVEWVIVSCQLFCD
jgi:hypothetical protein